VKRTASIAAAARTWGGRILLCLGLALGCGSEAPEPRTDAHATGHDAPTPSATARRNLILVTIDTTRADAIGAYGQSRPTTPTLDALADQGVLFEQVVSSNPETLPSHATLFTGKWPFSHGVRANAGHVLADRHETLAERLRDAGYHTRAEVAAPVLGGATRITQGFDVVRDPDSEGVRLERMRQDDGIRTLPVRTGSDVGASAREFLHRTRARPFFLWLHFFDPHDPYDPPARFARKIPDSAYHAEVAAADAEVGRVLESLERRGLADDTYVVVTSDHGEGLGDHGEATHSYFIFEATMRVPLLLAGPDLPAGVRIDAPVRTIDVLPTLLELLGVERPPDVDGDSLAGAIRGEPTPTRTIYGEATRLNATLDLPTLRFLREGSWKYIHKVNPELYDLSADPGETNDLARRRPEVAERLRGKLGSLLAQAPATRDATADIDAETAARLAALGYAEQAPAPDPHDPLRLWGDDPAHMADEVRLLSEAPDLLRRELWAEARKRLETLHRRYPDSPYVLQMLAESLVGLGSDEATGVLEDLLTHAPCNEVGLNELGRLYRAAQRYQALERILSRGVEHCPDLFENLNNYAWALATLPVPELRDGTKAIALLEPALAALPEVNPMALDTLAAAHAEAGAFETAIEVQTRALERVRASGGPDEAIAMLEQHLEEFRAGRPIREP
jgi:arylsulfatase A-like enzyme